MCKPTGMGVATELLGRWVTEVNFGALGDDDVQSVDADLGEEQQVADEFGTEL